jgi:beta-phosphoglucomutase-like phosphatase (HAD superfamily)
LSYFQIQLLATSHGVRTIETMQKWAPHKATLEHASDFERRLAEESDGVSLLPGISTLLQKIPRGKWGIATAGNEYMARKRLAQCNITAPDAIVCGDMVNRV